MNTSYSLKLRYTYRWLNRDTSQRFSQHKAIGIHLFLSLLFLLPSCSGNRRKYEQIVTKWMGKEVIFPDSIKILDGDYVTIPETEYTIISYFDSVGCTVCRMKLPLWQRFMSKVDSIIGPDRVKLMVTVDTPKLGKLRSAVKEGGFTFPVYLDDNGQFNHLNQIPDQPELQTFLLDRDNRVMLIGNPAKSQSIERLYLSRFASIAGCDIVNDTDTPVYEYDFGKVKADNEVSHTFGLINDTSDTLKVNKLVTSCECTKATISSQIIPPGEEYNVTVTFQDNESGEFERSVILYFENNIPEVLFELTGEIINKTFN